MNIDPQGCLENSGFQRKYWCLGADLPLVMCDSFVIQRVESSCLETGTMQQLGMREP